jgi:opacity protein-like surface antigen
MKRFLASALTAATLAAVLVPAAHAADLVGVFSVAATLTSKCYVSAGDNGTLNLGTYESFAGDLVNSTGITITWSCTRGITAPKVVFDSDGATGTKTTGTADADSVVGTGVVAGLRYEITATKTAPTLGTAADANSLGTAATLPYKITSKIFGSQAGDATAATSQPRTLTLTY